MNKPRKRQGEIVHSSVWNPKNKKAIGEMFEKGASIVEVCKFLGINKSTWYRWLKDERKKDFQEAAQLGLESSEAYWVQLGRDNVENKSFNTALYYFLMVNKFNYRSAYSKQEKDVKEVKEHKIEVKKSVDIGSILEKVEADLVKEQIH